jgi:hypothetical protein
VPDPHYVLDLSPLRNLSLLDRVLLLL